MSVGTSVAAPRHSYVASAFTCSSIDAFATRDRPVDIDQQALDLHRGLRQPGGEASKQ
eukprot:CAMPEP_0194774330 /NCGR_PEP_ID=MMETSP0323_2-20130528/57325_1 /TAXON_ID=2866 ORGANISM="Crypthecodinium cohnii, Strain Seligo" /NCGR_SAMPLE_ID=MMETSP0323_2 /ASSEMBLY_ACC=CAM_ASM_000346 /LENGTH=57 /DNA_ID=CAMNT_0039709811 /DNA_START=139 /DNA_END=312 /DNA_ORIENTATION=-